MGWEPIAIATGVVLFGLLILSVISSTRREQREEAERQTFYKAVEEARQKQIEGATTDRNISGVWKGDGTGFFGVGRRLEFKFNHSGNSISGQLKDDYGEAMLAGYFVWPYVMFDVRRDDTSFEFRGTVAETGGTRSIQGKYRYSTTDTTWSVKEVNGNRVAAAASASSIKSAVVAEPKPPVEEQVTTAIGNGPEPDLVPIDLDEALPLAGLQTGSNECPKCHRLLDTNFEFCLYCSQDG